METSAASSVQPRLRGAALRNLSKANRPVVTASAMLQHNRRPLGKWLASFLVGTAKGLMRFGSAIFEATRWLAKNSVTTTRSIVQRVRSLGRPEEDELKQLATASRYAILSNRFVAIAPLSEEEREALKKLDYAQRRVHQAGSDIVIEGEQPAPIFIVSGWASRVRVLSTGRRQILDLLVPGDGIGFHGDAEPVSAATVTAITTVETVDAIMLVQMAHEAERFPGIALALERMAAQEDVFSDNQILRLGALSESRRVAHLLLELQWRLSEVGLGIERVFPLPLTNETIADTLGMEPADVRRAMGALRSRRMFSLRYGRATLLSKKKIDLGGDFRPPEISVREREGFRSLVAH